MSSRRAPQGRGLVMPPGRGIPRPPSSKPTRPRPPGEAPEDPELDAAGAELASLAAVIRDCEECGPGAGARVLGSGYPRAAVFLLKDRPHDEDVEAETAFAAEASALHRAFDALSLPLGWVYGTCVVHSGRDAGPDDLRHGMEHVLVELEVVRPKVLVCFGFPAAEGLAFVDGRCGLDVPGDIPQGEPVPVRPGLVVLRTEPLPEGVTSQAAKRRLWRDLQRLPSLLR